MNDALVIILTAALLGVAGALSGSFLVLRKMGMLADAISHAVLPGLVFGYWLAQGQSLIATFLGAIIAGILTAALTEVLQSTRRVHADTATGIIFASLFALGTFLVSRYFANVHLDADAVLYGEIAFAPFETLDYGSFSISKPLVEMSLLAALNLTAVVLFYKELKLATFDPGLAASLGFSPTLVHYGLMLLVSLTTVGGFEAVGAIMVVAFLIVPAATAYLLTDRLPRMLALAVACGVFSAVTGYYVALWLDVSISGMMTVIAGALLLLAALFSPQQGVVWHALRRRRDTQRTALEDALRGLAQGAPGSLAPLPVEARLVRAGYATAGAGGLALTAAGRHEAARLTRAHRLWETYLAAEGAPLEALHGEAHLMEHFFDPQAVDALDEAIGHPAVDPHGDPIPRAGGTMASAVGVPLSAWPIGRQGRVSHLEDEPEATFAELVHLGFKLGQPVTVLAREGDQLRVRYNGSECVLSPAVAAQVQVVGD
jgi:manganese/zinc/iron transport system permease protein